MLLEIRNLSKNYGGVTALQDVNLSLEAGTITGLAGENGAGKSTLLKCITGAETATSGEIIFNGQTLPQGNPAAIRRAGIETVYQHLNLCSEFTATENIYLGREETCRILGIPFLAKGRMTARAKELLGRLNTSIDPGSKTGNLSGGQQQAVAIARAMLFSPKLLILDEPTAALDEKAAREFLALLETLRQSGMAILLVSHRTEELRQITSRIIQLQHGKMVKNQA